MKKTALLAVSALSLGVVGLAGLTPIVNAIDPVSQTATVTVVVNETLGINANDVTVAAIGANKLSAETPATIQTTNNSSTSATLTVNTSTTTTAMTSKTTASTIPASANLAAGTAAWGVKTTGNWQAVPAKGAKGLTLGTDADAIQDGNGIKNNWGVKFGVSSAANTIAGDYAVGITYTFTKS